MRCNFLMPTYLSTTSVVLNKIRKVARAEFNLVIKLKNNEVKHN